MSIYSMDGRIIRGEGFMGVARVAGSWQNRKVLVTLGKIHGDAAALTVVELARDDAIALMTGLQRLFR